MRHLFLGLAATCAACAASPAAPAPDAIESVHDAARVFPEPAIIAVEYLYWGNPTSSWSVSRSGQGRYRSDGETQTFPVSAAQFEEIRDIFRPYESRRFECRRLITDGPYGHVIWSSREGQEDQRTTFDAGCVSGDADDLFERLDRADRLIASWRGAQAQ